MSEGTRDEGEAVSGRDLEVVEFEGTDTEWDGLVDGMDGSTFCHLAGWRHVIGSVLGHTAIRWVALDRSGRVTGLLPLARVRSRLFGDYLLSMPFLSYGGPLGSEGARTRLAHEARRLARETNVDLLELRSRTPLDGGLAVSDRKLTVLLPLRDTPESMWEKGLKAKLRSQIRRPMKEGMTPHFGPGQLDGFYHVFSRTMRDLGTPVLPRAFFEAIAERFPSQVVFCTVRHEGKPVAAGCGFLWKEEFEITWAGALREHSRAAPNMLLYWSLIEETIRRGGNVFNFGRCSPDSGTHRFKRQWGGNDHPLPWAQWSPSGFHATPSPDSVKFRLATHVWSRLPVFVANTVGPFLARSLP